MSTFLLLLLPSSVVVAHAMVLPHGKMLTVTPTTKSGGWGKIRK